MTVDVIREPAGTMAVLPPQTIVDREIDHRVANSLQLISSLLSLQARQASDPSIEDALSAAVHRIGAVGAVHKQLHRSGAPCSVDIARYLFDLAESIERSFGGGAGRKQISAHIQAQTVSPNFASVLGILITELVINACKHAYAPDEPGDIEICLFFPTASQFRMEVRDYGGKPAARETLTAAGLGTSIIQAMCCKLNATHIAMTDDEGTRCQIHGAVFP